MQARTLLASVLAATLLSACAGVPDRLPPPRLQHAAPLAGLPVKAGAQWPAQDWWTRFHDPQLDHLIGLAEKSSPSLSVAQARVESAQQSIRVAAAQAGLKIDGSATLQRQRLSEHGLIPTRFLGFTWYNQADAGVQLSYDFDWWGRKHAQVMAAVGQARAAQARQSAAALALETAVADAYFGWQGDQARLAVARRQVAVHRHLLKIVGMRVRAGLEPSDDREQARAGLSAARQQLISIRSSAAIRHATLATLVGVSPEKLPPLKPHALPAINSGLPAHARLDLIARRPDIAASRWRVESALHGVQAARAAFYPDLSLSAMAGLSSIDLGKFLEASSRTFSIAPALHLPIFEGGRLKAGYGAARAQLKAAIAGYDDTVDQAARQVAKRALTLQQVEAERGQQQQQLQATQTLSQNSRDRLKQGLTDARPVLQAQAQLLQQRDAALALHARAVAADIALIQALGGGYHVRHPSPVAHHHAPQSPRKQTP